MAERDLASIIRGLSPGALAIFKRQLASLPERDRQTTFARLSGIKELEDITGRPTPTPAQKPARKEPEPLPVQQDLPMWQKALATATAPLNWVSRNITEPFGAFVTDPWTPSIAGTENLSGSQRRMAEYKAWDDPNLGFLGVKGVVETLPWFLLPTAGGVVGRLGGLAAKGGKLGMAAGLGAKALKPLAAAEQAMNPFAWQRGIESFAAKRAGGKIVGKAVGKMGEKIAPFKIEGGLVRESENLGGSFLSSMADNEFVVHTISSTGVKKLTIKDFRDALEQIEQEALSKGASRINILGRNTEKAIYSKVGFVFDPNRESWTKKISAGLGKIMPKKVTPEVTQGLVKRELEGSEKRLVALSKRQDEYQNMSMGQVERYKWYPGSGSVYDRITGRRIYTDRITYLIDRTRRRIVARSDGFIYFSRNNKNYKVAIPDFETIKTEYPHPLLRLEGGVIPKPAIFKAEATPEVIIPGKVIGAGLGKIMPKTGKVPTKIMSEMFPEGLPEEQATATKWLTDLTRKSKPLTKETLELRKPEHAARSAEYKRILDEKVASGMPISEARKVALGALEGEYSKAPLTPAFLEQLKEIGKYEATLLKMIYDAPFKYGFEWENAFAAFGRLTNEGHLQMNQIQTLERVFGSELAKALLEKNRTLGQKIWFNAVDAINVPRGLLSMADLSGFGRQGWILTTTRPDKAMEAVIPMLQSMLHEKNAIFMDDVFLNRKHIDKVLRLRPDFLTKWAGEATDIVAREEGFASRWLNKLPVVGQIYKGSTRAYTTVLNDLRTANVSAAISGWEKGGFKYLAPDEAVKLYADNAKAIFNAKFYTDNDINLLARTVSWASGRGSLPPELARHAGIANAVFFAPKLIASRIQFPFAALPSVTSSRLARQEAARELLSFVGTGGGIIGMAMLSKQAEVPLDPRSPDFGKMIVGDTRLDIWTGYSQYLRFIAQMATAQGKTESGRITAKDRGDLIGRFAQSKLSPAAGFIVDWVRGETYLGEDMPPRSAKSVVGQLYQRMMPLAIQDMVDGYVADSWSGGLTASWGFYGVGVATYTDEVKRARDRVAQKEFGMSWDEVGTKYGRATQLKLEQTPTIIEAEKEHEDRFAAGIPTSMDNFRNEGKLIEEVYRKDIDNAVQEFRATNNGLVFREKVTKASEAKRKAYSLRTKKDEYQDIIAYYNQPIPPDKLAEMNPGDVLRREFYQKMFDPIKMYDNFGNYRFEEAEKIEQDFITKHGQQAMDYIEEYQGARWQDKPTELLMLEEAKELLRPYWDVEDKVWAMYPEGLREISDQIKVIRRTDEERAKYELKKYPMILRAWELIAQYRKQMRQYNPAIEQAYKIFY